jgi:hypothetical protein
MPSYWWQCTKCPAAPVLFGKSCKSRGVVHFIWDELLPARWDQSLLAQKCTACGESSLRITYEFPRKPNKEILRVIHVVGTGPHGDYLPMMWETSPSADLSTRWFDFKYIRGRSIWGMNKAAVLERADLHALFQAYRDRTGDAAFP